MSRMTVQVKDIIAWLQEEAIHYGELDVSCNTPHTCMGVMQMQVEQDFPIGGLDLRTISLEQTEEERTIRSVYAKRKQYMDSFLKPVVARTEHEVINRLESYGSTKPDLNGKSLRQMVVDLSNLTKPKGKDYIEVRVDVGLTSNLKEMIQVRFGFSNLLSDLADRSLGQLAPQGIN